MRERLREQRVGVRHRPAALHLPKEGRVQRQLRPQVFLQSWISLIPKALRQSHHGGRVDAGAFSELAGRQERDRRHVVEDDPSDPLLAPAQAGEGPLDHRA